MIHFNLSNTLDRLLEILHTKIKSERRSLFDEFHILVANVNYKRAIQEYFLKKENVCMNLKFSFLEYFLADVFLKLLEIDKTAAVILTLERNKIILNSLIFSILSEKEFQSKYRDIFDILIGEFSSEEYKITILWKLSEKLTDLFREYEFHRYNEIIKNWKNSKGAYDLTPEKLESFQRDIYYKIFFERKFFKNSSKFYFSLVELFERVKDPGLKLNISALNVRKIYLFGFSLISKIHLEMISFLKDYIDFELFIPVYTGNILSEGNPEKIFSHFPYKLTQEDGNERLVPSDRKFDQIDDFISPVVSTIYLIKSFFSSEEISISWNDKIFQEDTLLSATKNLFMNRKAKKIKQDESITIFSASSKVQEVEAVYNSIFENIQRDSRLEFDDILILVPDMKKYRNIIKDVFNRNPYLFHPEIKRKERLPFHIYEKNVFKESLFNLLLSSFFELLENNFSKFDFFKFLENPLIMERFKIELDDLLCFRKWIEKLNAFDEDSSFKFSTFSSLLRRLKLGFIMESKETPVYNEILPYSDSFTDIERLDIFVQIVEKLIDYKRKSEGQKSLGEWVDFIRGFTLDFFPEESTDSVDELHIYISFLRNLELLKEIEFLRENRTYTFKEVKLHFLNLIVDILERNISSLFNGVTVSSFLPMRSIPFKIIYILGMNEGDFPSENDRSSLNLRNLKVFWNDIDRRYMDNFLFLEAIFSAGEKVYISYVGTNLEEDAELYPSSTVQSFESILNNYLLEEKFKPIVLPKNSFSKYYIQDKKDILTNIFYTPHRIVSYLRAGVKVDFKRYYSGKCESTEESNKKINIKNLADFVLNPIEEAIKRKTGIYDSKNLELSVKTMRSLELDPRIRSKILNNSISLFIKNRINSNKISLREVFDNVYSYHYYNGDVPEPEVLNEIEKTHIFFKGIEEILCSFCGKYKFYEAICIGDIEQLEEKEKKYYNGDSIVGNFSVSGILENIFFEEGRIIFPIFKNRIDKNKLGFDFNTIFFRLFVSFLNIVDKEINSGNLIFIDIEGKTESLDVFPLKRETLIELLNYYNEKDNFDLIPLNIVCGVKELDEILDEIEAELKGEYSFFDLPDIIKVQRRLEKFIKIDERLKERVELLKKVAGIL